MKTKIKRHSRSALSILLTICMLVSCMTVGLIASDAAKMQGEKVGATDYYLYYRTDNTKSLDGMTAVKMTKSGSTYSASFNMVTGNNFDLGVGTSSTPSSTWVTSSWTVTKDSGFNFVNIEDNSGVYFIVGSVKTAGTVTATFTPNTTLALSTSGGGSTGETTYVVTGDTALTGTSSWSNNSSSNTMTYDSDKKIYTKSYTVSTTGSTFDFRIVESGSWGTTWGYSKANKVDGAGIVSTWTSNGGVGGSDNNIRMSLSQAANIEICFDDSKSDTSAITVIVTPTTATVTAAVTPAGSGTATVNSSSSSVVNYNDTVSLNATPGSDYLFSKWTTTNGKVNIASTTTASTTGTVLGTDTVTANFVKKSYTVSKGTGTGFTITTPSSAQTKQWGTSVSVTAQASSSLYLIDYLYYLNEGSETKQVISGGAAAGAGTTATLSGSFEMPKNNVTVYAHVHEKTSNTITYGVCTDQSGYGYVNVGLYHNSASTIKYTIDSGSKVLEGDNVNFCARPVGGTKFVGWYDNAAGSDTALSTSQDYTVASPSGNYYAKFDAFAKPETGKIKLLIRSATNAKQVYWTDNNTADNITTTDANSMTYGGYTCYLYTRTYTGSTNVIIRDSDAWTYQTVDLAVSSGKTYFVNWDGTEKQKKGTATEASFDEYYPVKYYVTNPDKGNMANTYTNAFAKKSTATNLYFKASDTTNWKTKVTTTGFTSDDTDYETTDTSRSKTMYSGYREHKATVTFIEKKYYKVNFSAGAGGTITATVGGKTITSGTPVMEGTSVTITATPNSGYAVSGWTASGSLTGTSTNASRNFTIGADTTAKVYFSKSKGTDTNKGATILGYKESASGEDNPYNFNVFNTTYVRNGRVYGYIEKSSTSQKVYDFQCYNKVPSTDNDKKEYYTEQYYRGNDDTWANTQFTKDITDIARHNYDGAYNDTCYWIRFTASAKVKAIMIDLGPVESATSNKARPDNDNNTYHIIPIYNTDISKVTVYAKDASFRGDSEYDYLSGIADTVISNTTGVTNIAKQTEFETAVATKGSSITVTTTVDPNHRGRYYVRGYSVNGVTPELYNYSSGGEYTMTYTIPADFDDDYLEITPIYAENGVTNIRFYIENYDEAFQSTGWGNTLAVYPYYENASGNYAETKHNAFGGYPGQPVINNGGRRFIEVPANYKTLTVDGTVEDCHVKGVTLSNDYFDIVHRDYCREVDDHLQTYDYDDFYKIYKETSDGKEVNGRTTVADQITFAFKHRTATNNFSDSSNTVAYSTTGKTVHAPYDSFTAAQKDTKFKNGWEPLLDYHDRPIDLFGKQLSSANQTKEPLLVVSDDYAITYAGRYATTWTVYRKDGTNYTKIDEIAPSALIVATQARLGTGTYPAVTDKDGFPSTTGHKLADYSDEYQTLKAYADTPVQITYESAIRNQDGYEKHWSMDGGSSEVSKRSDGRWFYSYQGEIINADLRIDYTNEYKGEESTVWTTDAYKNNTNTGTVTGATVHFTNTAGDTAEGPYDLTDFHDTADYDGDIVSNFNHYYKFIATEGSGYIFQGWYMERDGISTAVNADDIKKLTGKSQMTSNATFVARYVKNPAGHLTINHTLADGSTGTATTYIGIEKSADGNTWTNVTGTAADIFVRQDSFSINDTDVMSYNSGYTLRVTLKTVVNDDTSFDRFSAATGENDHSSEFFSTAVSTSGDTSTTRFEIPVDDLFEIPQGSSFPAQKDDYGVFTYYSHTTKRPELIINHKIDPTSDATAEGTAYVRAEVQTTAGAHVAWLNESNTPDYVQGTNLVVPYNYFNATGGYKLKVDLKTTMEGFTEFDKFSILGETLGNHATTDGQSVQISDADSKRTKIAEITFPIANLFDGTEPRLTELPYLSRLEMPDYKYVIKYTYPAYTDKAPVSYTAKASFAPEDLTTYMSLTNGDLAFKGDNEKKTFACSKAPYEDNFQKVLNWAERGTFGERTYSAQTHTLSLQVTIGEAEQQRLNVQFNLPYGAQSAGNEYQPLVTDGKVVKTDTRAVISSKNTYGRDWFIISGKRNKDVSGTDPVFVKAPLIIVDTKNTSDTSDDQNYYFKYWTVKTEETANNASREYTRCYDYEFNLAIFQDCIITPEYDTIPFANRGALAPPTTYNGYDRFDPDVNRKYYALEDSGVSITFLENSRNQYNNGDGGNAAANRKGAADRIYSDFLLTFDNNPMVTLNTLGAGKKQAGLIIQNVGDLELVDGKYVVKKDSYYSAATGYGGLTAGEVKTKIESGDFSGVAKSQFDVTKLDNKNRIQYYYGIDNARVKASDATADGDGIIRVGDAYNNQHKVFKAFAYIGDGDGTGNLTNVVVSPTPIYFTIYTDATITPGYYMPTGS